MTSHAGPRLVVAGGESTSQLEGPSILRERYSLHPGLRISRGLYLWELILVLSLVFAGFALRFWDLANLPPGLLYDEAYNTLDIGRVLAGEHTPFFPGNYGREALFIYLQAASVRMFGPTFLALRLVPAALGTLTLILSYALFKRMFSRRVGWLALAWLSSSLWQLIFSRIGLRAVSLPVLELIALYCLWRGISVRHPPLGTRWAWGIWANPWLIMAGIGLGASLYTYTAARFLPLVVLLFVLFEAAIEPSRRRSLLAGLGIIGLIAAITALPLSHYFWLHPQDFTERAEQVSMLSQAGSTGTVLSSIWYSASATLGAFGVTGDRNWDRNLPGQPIFDPLSLLLFAGGVAISLWRWRQPASRLALLWLGVMLLPHVLTVTNLPSYLRLVGILPVVFVFPAISVDTMVHPRITWAGKRALGLACVAILLTTALAVGLLARQYFVTWAGNPEVAAIFSADRYAAVRFILAEAAAEEEQDEGGVSQTKRIYISMPSGDGDEEMLASAIYSPQGRHTDLASRLSRFDARDCLVLPAGGAGPTLYAFPAGAELPPGRIESLLGSAQVMAGNRILADTEGYLALRLNSAPAFAPMNASRYSFGGIATLEGFDLPASVPAGKAITPSLYWRVDQRADKPLRLGVHLVDAEKRAVARRDSRGMELHTRHPGERAITWIGPAIPADAPTGAYYVVVMLYEADSLRRLPVSDAEGHPMGEMAILGPIKVRGQAANLELGRPVGADLGDSISLAGYDLDKQEVKAGDELRITLGWRARSRPDQDYKVFVHLLDSQDRIVGQHDGPPLEGRFPTSLWEAGDLISDTHIIRIAEEMPAGQLRVAVGLYDPATGTRLVVRDLQGIPQPDGRLFLAGPKAR